MKIKKTPARTVLSLSALALLVTGGLLYAGPLDPPAGPVTSTYKTLAEVEPRTAINLTNTPGDADSLFKITQPGSYYLTGNLTGGSSKKGVEVASDNVTLDLNGFALLGVAGSLSGIGTDVGHNNVTVRNGAVTGWGGDGVELATGSASLGQVVESVAVRSCGVGIRVRNGVVRSCTVSACPGGAILGLDKSTVESCHTIGGSIGISTGDGSVIRSCIVEQSTGDGISAGTDGVIAHCTARANAAFGLGVSLGGRVVDCVARDNTSGGIFADAGSVVEGCSATSNNTEGIVVFAGCLVVGCAAESNGLSGIKVTSNCGVRDNVCKGNGTLGIGAGIFATGADNRIEGNNCTLADRGIDISGAGNIIIKNTCSGNTIDWVIVANNVVGPILDRRAPASVAISGFSFVGSLATTDPHANFSY